MRKSTESESQLPRSATHFFCEAPVLMGICTTVMFRNKGNKGNRKYRPGSTRSVAMVQLVQVIPMSGYGEGP